MSSNIRSPKDVMMLIGRAVTLNSSVPMSNITSVICSMHLEKKLQFEVDLET